MKIQSVEKWTLTHLFSLLYNLVRGMYVLCDALEGVLISELFVENLKFERIFFSLYLVG